MSGQLRVLDCEFCVPPVVDHASPQRHLTNRIIARYGEMLLVADHAPMTLGHLLLLPRDHHTGFADFLVNHPRALTGMHRFRRRYRDAFGGCTVIEHGSGPVASMAGACIDHAHWHLFPFNDELGPIVEGDYGDAMGSIGSIAEFAREYADSDYLLYWDMNTARATSLDTATRFPQYARSVVARHLDPSAAAYDWDWALRADDELLVHTLTVARTAFIADDDIANDAADGNEPAREIA